MAYAGLVLIIAIYTSLPFSLSLSLDPLVCYHQSNTFTNGTDENITVMKPTYVLCRVVRTNFLTLVPDDYYKLNAAPGTVLTSYNHSSTYWDLLILLPCHCTNTMETMEIIGIPRDQNNHVQPIKFRVMWDCSSCQEGELTMHTLYLVSSCLGCVYLTLISFFSKTFVTPN